MKDVFWIRRWTLIKKCYAFIVGSAIGLVALWLLGSFLALDFDVTAWTGFGRFIWLCLAIWWINAIGNSVWGAKK